MTQESQISARGQAGARTDLWVLFEAPLTTPPLLFSRAGLRQCSKEHTQAGLGQVPLTRQRKGHFLCDAFLTPLGRVVIYLETAKLTQLAPEKNFHTCFHPGGFPAEQLSGR